MRSARRIVLFLTALYWVVLFVVTHLPPARMLHGPGGDKLHHFLAYLVLSFMLGATLWQAFPGRRRFVPLLVLLAGAGYGVLDELTQIPVGRQAEVGDWVADLSGAAVAAAVLFLMLRVTRPRTTELTGPDSSLAIESR
jgi:VanZ family protein